MKRISGNFLPLPEGSIVCAAVQQAAFYSTEIFPPLLLQMDQRPLPPAEREVLQTGEGEEVLLTINHPIRTQVTPEGKADWSTVTV